MSLSLAIIVVSMGLVDVSTGLVEFLTRLLLKPAITFDEVGTFSRWREVIKKDAVAMQLDGSEIGIICLHRSLE